MARERAERGGDVAPSQPHSGLSIAEIRQLVALMQNSDVEEVVIEQEGEGLKLVLRKPAPVLATAGLDGDPGDFFDSAEEPERGQDRVVEIGAPLVGLFRSSMKLGEKPLVSAGDVVREGQVVAAIEALNVLNEVEAPSAGRILEIRATDGQPVEYGQALLLIEPQKL